MRAPASGGAAKYMAEMTNKDKDAMLLEFLNNNGKVANHLHRAGNVLAVEESNDYDSSDDTASEASLEQIGNKADWSQFTNDQPVGSYAGVAAQSNRDQDNAHSGGLATPAAGLDEDGSLAATLADSVPWTTIMSKKRSQLASCLKKASKQKTATVSLWSGSAKN
jgi:hypothetical protein